MSSVVCLYIAWPSYKNVIAHIQLGFSVTAYIIGSLTTDLGEKASAANVMTYTWILLIGGFALASGSLIGSIVVIPTFNKHVLKITNIERSQGIDTLRRISIITLTAASLLMLICFYFMGFIPFFADDPLDAKFFRGDYRTSYERVALLYRGAYLTLVSILPVMLTVWWLRKRDIISLALSISGTALIFITLNRSSILSGVIILIGVIMSRKKITALIFLMMIMLIYPIGGSLFYILGYLTGKEQFSDIYNTTSIWSLFVSGAPDVSDQLTFFQRYMSEPTLTYGRTFLGGLIPYHFQWNPAVWTLQIQNPRTNLNDITSGGLRLPVQLWGFTAFGWFGVVLVPLVSGFFTGIFMRIVRKVYLSSGIAASVIVVLLFNSYGSLFYNYYLLSLYSIPAVVVTIYLINHSSSYPKRMKKTVGSAER